ncbi:MAG TPA: hypothetical protein VGI83_04050, partial [Gemmatimonadales bacterium]
MARAKALAAIAAFLPVATVTSAQQPGAPVAVGYSSSVSSKGATLEFQLADGSTARIELSAGQVLVDGHRVGLYKQSGDFDKSFRDLIRQGASLSASEMLTAAKAWRPKGIRPAVAEIPAAIQLRLGPIQAAPAAPAPPAPPAPPAVVNLTGHTPPM